MSMKKNIEVWVEGYLATGCEGIPVKAHLAGTYEAVDLDDAVRQHIATLDEKRRAFWRRHESGIWTDWGCRVFDNEADARKSFG